VKTYIFYDTSKKNMNMFIKKPIFITLVQSSNMPPMIVMLY
jgi:hypothetical protein